MNSADFIELLYQRGGCVVSEAKKFAAALERAGLVCIPATADEEEVGRVYRDIRGPISRRAHVKNIARVACASVRGGRIMTPIENHDG